MNIKFKMPKFHRTLTNKSMWKELLLTFLATTISIVLTFGTAHLLDVRQRKKDRKMSALMVTGNVERFARVLDGLADDLMQRDTVASWLLGLPLDSRPSGTEFFGDERVRKDLQRVYQRNGQTCRLD